MTVWLLWIDQYPKDTLVGVFASKEAIDRVLRSPRLSYYVTEEEVTE